MVQEDEEPEPVTVDDGVVAGVVKAVPKFEHEAVEEDKLSAHEALGYLLSWKLLFDHFEDATFQLRANYVAHLRNLVTESAGMKSFAKSDGVPILSHFLEYIFSVLSVGNTKSTWNMSQQNWEEIDMDAFDILDPDALSFKLLAAHLYLRALRTVPSLVRTWWSECKNRQLVLSVESFTEKFFSPAIISREVEFVQTADQGAFENMSIRASKNANEVAAAYNIEDAKLEIVFRLPSSFPLRQVEVETGGGSTGGSGSSGGRTAGVNESRWRSWLLATSGVIIAQNGTILDALQLFKKNVSLHFEGVEDCAICYSVIGVIDRQLPNKQCKTCKHLFHASCLYKWLRTSNQSTCPLCRSLW
ncbi:hypothetical protein BJ742DRAFT_349555 [Cladochytrium replicatum]|nr:hypothetical protein BJ742DRAFT_349555 [Cladochytrium replicatum]